MKVTKGQNPLMKSIDSAKANDSTKDIKSLDKNAKNPAMNANNVGTTSKVNVSEQAKHIQKAKEIASDQSIDHAKVARLQKLIDEGKYNIDASAVADRMVDEHFMMKS